MGDLHCKNFFANLDKTNGQPFTRPLSDMEQVLSWKPDCGSVSTVPLRGDQKDPSRPRTLVCHDMAGGYLEDRFIQGVHVDDCYRFYNWTVVDVFVYFSHHFVTIPTPWWTNAAHRNGVKMLGTVITEWDDGKKNCEQFLATEESRHDFVKKLVLIAKFYGFEGWLINIENEIPLEKMTSLVCFVQELTQAMHESIPGSLVIWYDSVIMSGVLQWQNELNMLNREFFDSCDGLFVNYTWKDYNLSHTAEAAGSRIHDVYVGVDVFGRGCKGGGGFNTIEALTDVRTYNLSVALFAPGWVYEKLGKQDFVENESKFWSLLMPKCDVHCLGSLPLTTTFCQGWGMRYHVDGRIVGKRPWTNMSMQSVQPIGPQTGVTYDVTKAYHGGGSLKITCNEDSREVELMQTNIELINNFTYYVSMTFQGISASNIALKFLLERTRNNDSRLMSTVIGRKERNQTGQNNQSQCLRIVHLENDMLDEHPLFKAVSTKVDEPGSWVTHWFSVEPIEDVRLLAVSVVIEKEESPVQDVRLGCVRVLPSDNIIYSELSNLRVCDIMSRTVTDEGLRLIETNLTLCWDGPLGPAEIVDHYLVYQSVGKEWAFVGATHLTTFRVCNLKTSESFSEFKVQVVYNGGLCANFDEAPVISALYTASA